VNRTGDEQDKHSRLLVPVWFGIVGDESVPGSFVGMISVRFHYVGGFRYEAIRILSSIVLSYVEITLNKRKGGMIKLNEPKVGMPDTTTAMFARTREYKMLEMRIMLSRMQVTMVEWGEKLELPHLASQVTQFICFSCTRRC
jgi:hypothetical protein